jgi:hypothetical protein
MKFAWWGGERVGTGNNGGVLAGFSAYTRPLGEQAVTLTKSGIFFSAELYRQLGSPEYAQLLHDAAGHRFALMRCEGDNHDGVVKLNQSKGSFKQHRIVTTTFMRFIQKQVGEAEDKTARYRLPGEYLPKERAYIFDVRAKSLKECRIGKEAG